jgi:hypothetical protein
MARTSTARKQKRKTKTKALARKVIRRAMPAKMGKATGSETGKDHQESGVPIRAGEAMWQIKREGGGVSLANKARALITQNDPDAVRAGLAEIADALDVASGSDLGAVYSRAMGTAMQALQVLLTLPFLNFQIWQNAMSGVRGSNAEEGA